MPIIIPPMPNTNNNIAKPANNIAINAITTVLSIFRNIIYSVNPCPQFTAFTAEKQGSGEPLP